MAFFRSAKGRARAERERTKIVECNLGDIPGDPGAWRPSDEPLRDLEIEMESFWGDAWRGLCVTVVAALFGVAVWFAIKMLALPGVHVLTPAHALDAGQYGQVSPETKAWFNSLGSRKGNCCSIADGRAITDADTDMRGNHFWVRVDGEWIEVADDALVMAPNRIGTPVVWPMRDGAGKIAIRCFLPGSGA